MPDDSVMNDTIMWMDWTLAFLEQRKLYHKKAYTRKAILERMAKELLSKDELEAIDREAEAQVSRVEQGQPASAEMEDEPEHEDIAE